MNIAKTILILGIGFGAMLSPLNVATAAPNSSIPAVIEAGFALWGKGGGIDGALNTWQKGGLLEGDRKVATQVGSFRTFNQALGNYKSHDLLQTKGISRNSQVQYLAINFERGAVYARFLLYRTDNDWVVQNMDFSARPEALMPWLAFEGDKAVE
jgi:hypothetical protein